MRLSPQEVAAIKAAAAEAFGPEAVVRLFGSRVRDDLRGGDIDLHIETDRLDAPLARHRFRAILFEPLGERWPDVVVSMADRPRSAIEKIAMRDGIIL